MKLALAVVCFGLVWLGLMDLEPFRPTRTGGARVFKPRPAHEARLARRRRLS